MKLDPRLLETLMDQALNEARQASVLGDVPVGAVIALGKEIIATGRNEMELRQDATAHAETLAIRRAAKLLGNWRLSDCVLCVTLEPCTMCMGAIRLARIPVVVFGASDQRMGAVGSLYDLSQDSRLGEGPRVISGVREKEAAQVLAGFFESRRDSQVNVLH